MLNTFATAVAVETETATANETPSYQDIADLAYKLWEQRGSPEGSPESDWYEAERQLCSHEE